MIDGPRSRRAWEYTLLATILPLAAVLRFAYLPSRGLIYWDEGKFALEGLRIQAGLRSLFGAHVNLLAGKAIGTAKPTHALLIALAYGLFGIHDYTGMIVNAAASVIGVGLTFVIGRRLFNPAVGLVAALLLAVSEYDVIYARSVLSENDASVFLLGAVALLVVAGWSDIGPRPGRLAAELPVLSVAGLLLGIGFTVNYRLLIYIGVLLAIDLLRSWHIVGARFAFTRMLAWGAGLMVAPLAWQLTSVISHAGGGVFFAGEIVEAPVTYGREVLYQLHGGKQSAFNFSPLLYVEWWIVRQGWLASALLLVGFAYAAVRRTFPWVVIALLVALPYAIYVFAPFVVPRNLAAALPFASLLTAAAIVSLATLLPRYRTATVLVAALVLGVIGTLMSWRLTAERSGFERAFRYVEVHGHGRTLTSNEVMVFYLRGTTRCFAPAVPYTVPDLRAYIRAGYHYAILDRHNKSRLVRRIRQLEPRVVSFPALGDLHIGESPISSENSNPPNPDAETEYVDVYRLDPNRLPRSPIGTFTPCSRDEVT